MNSAIYIWKIYTYYNYITENAHLGVKSCNYILLVEKIGLKIRGKYKEIEC